MQQAWGAHTVWVWLAVLQGNCDAAVIAVAVVFVLVVVVVGTAELAYHFAHAKQAVLLFVLLQLLWAVEAYFFAL